jgi:hypothetical protein
MLGDKIRIRSEGSPMEVPNDIFVESLQNGDWVVEHAYNSMSDGLAFTNAKNLALALQRKLTGV